MNEAHGSSSAAPGAGTVYDTLRRLILNLNLEPGTELDESPLSQRFGVSRTPVREALIRLSSEGLVTLQRGRGARVAPLDVRYLRDFFESLDILQRAVTRLAAHRRSEEQLEAIIEHMHDFEAGAAALDSDRVNLANYEFHIAIGRAARSAYLSQAYSRLMAEGLRLSYLCFSKHNRTDSRLSPHLGKTQDDHAEMVRAIRERDADAAEAVAGDHVRLFKKRVSDVLMSEGVTETIKVHPAA